MHIPINRLANAAPRAFDAILSGGKQQHAQQQPKISLDLTSMEGDSSVDGNCTSEGGSVMTYEDISEALFLASVDESTTGSATAAAPMGADSLQML